MSWSDAFLRILFLKVIELTRYLLLLVFIMCDTDQAITWNKNYVMSVAGMNKEKITSCSSLTPCRVPDYSRAWSWCRGGTTCTLSSCPPLETISSLWLRTPPDSPPQSVLSLNTLR